MSRLGREEENDSLGHPPLPLLEWGGDMDLTRHQQVPRQGVWSDGQDQCGEWPGGRGG